MAPRLSDPVVTPSPASVAPTTTVTAIPTAVTAVATSSATAAAVSRLPPRRLGQLATTTALPATAAVPVLPIAGADDPDIPPHTATPASSSAPVPAPTSTSSASKELTAEEMLRDVSPLTVPMTLSPRRSSSPVAMAAATSISVDSGAPTVAPIPDGQAAVLAHVPAATTPVAASTKEVSVTPVQTTPVHAAAVGTPVEGDVQGDTSVAQKASQRSRDTLASLIERKQQLQNSSRKGVSGGCAERVRMEWKSYAV